jgi:hypothetical protein
MILKKGSKAAKLWGKKMKLLRSKAKRKTTIKKRITKQKVVSRRRKTPTTRRKTTRLRTRVTKRKPMVSRRKRYSRRARSSGLKIGSSLKTGIIGEVVKGIGAGSLVGTVMSRVMPNSPITPIASTGAAFLAGGVTGGIAQVILSGGLANLGGLFGGGVSAPQQEFGV